jgi:hypothetical protein
VLICRQFTLGADPKLQCDLLSEPAAAPSSKGTRVQSPRKSRGTGRATQRHNQPDGVAGHRFILAN